MKINYKKTALRSTLFHIIYTLISWILFSFALSGIKNQMIIDEMFTSLRWLMFGFSLLTFLIMQIIIAVIYVKDGERRRLYLSATEGENNTNPTVMAHIRKSVFKESLAMVIPVAVIQLPIAIFYTAYNYGYAAAVFFESLNLGWIGFYQPWNNALVGMILNLGIVFLFSFFVRILAHISWEKHRIRK